MSTKAGLMTLEFEHGRWLAELRGEGAKVWHGEGLPVFEGPIDAIESLYPDLWAAMLAAKVIKPTGAA